MSITPSTRVVVLGGGLCLSLVICSRNFSDRGGPHFMASLIVGGIFYLFAMREFFVSPCLPRAIIVVGLLLAVAWNIAFLRLSPGADDDIHRYVWDGRLQRLGYNPYLIAPSDPAVKELHTPETRGLNNPDLSTPYPAGAELFFRGVTAIHESAFALKLAFVICEFAIAFVLLDALRSRGQGTHWVLAYAWNPLLAIEVAGSGHIDIVGTLLLIVSFSALMRRWRTIAAVSLGLAVSVKLLPIVLLPLYWKRVRIRDAALAAAVVALLYLPFLDHGSIPTGSLGTYVRGFRFNDPLFAMLERVMAPQVAVGLAVSAGFLIAVWLRRRSEDLAPDSFAWPMAASLLCAPVVYPWYLMWLLPFLRSASTLPLVIWTISILPTYYVWHLRTLGQPWVLPAWVMPLEYGSIAVVAALLALRDLSRPPVSHPSADQAG